MKKLFFLTLFFFSSSIFSFDIQFDELTLKNGVYVKKKSKEVFDGRVGGVQKGLIVNGLKEGRWQGFYEDGKLLWEGDYLNGLNTSSWIEYHKNGSVFATGLFEKGNKIGVWKLYDKNGKLIATELYEEGSIVETKIFKN